MLQGTGTVVTGLKHGRLLDCELKRATVKELCTWSLRSKEDKAHWTSSMVGLLLLGTGSPTGGMPFITRCAPLRLVDWAGWVLPSLDWSLTPMWQPQHCHSQVIHMQSQSWCPPQSQWWHSHVPPRPQCTAPPTQAGDCTMQPQPQSLHAERGSTLTLWWPR